MRGIAEFWKKVYNSRYFWFYLAVKEIKFKYRRSKLGGLWMMIQPLALTLIMAFVFSTIFQQDLGDYLVYILSGLVVWNLIIASFSNGGGSLNGAEAYIRQFNHPKAIYTLKSALVYTYTFLIELLGLVIWIIIMRPHNLILGIISLPATVICFFLISWGATTIAAYISAKYYDYPQLIGLILQAVYFVSPVFLQKEMFTGNPALLPVYQLNPISHMLNLVRDPFVYGHFPEPSEYLYVIVTILIVGGIAFIINKKNEKIIIFYL